MICISCNIEKSISCFEHQKNRPSPRKVCKQCRYTKRNFKKENKEAKERKRLWREQNKDKLRQNWEKATYGVTKEELGFTSCIICKSTERLCIDHCHNTERVRGILCSKCNTGLGMFEDNIERLQKAVEYLKDGPHFELNKTKYP